MDGIEEGLIVINGFLLLLISLIFLRLYFRYEKRNYLFLTLILCSCAIQMILSEIEGLSIIAIFFGFLMIILILAIILFPEKTQFDFDDDLFQTKTDSQIEDS